MSTRTASPPQQHRRGLRIAFYAPRASFLGPDVVGEATQLTTLLEALRQRGHAVEIASHVNLRDFWRGRAPARGIAAEASAIRRRMRRFQPDAWLVFGANGAYPDLFGWWQRKPYVLVGIDPWVSKRMPRRWRWPFALAFRLSLRRARRVAAQRPRSRDHLRARGIPEDKLELFLPATTIPQSAPTQEQARRDLDLPQDASIVLCVSRLAEGKERHKTDAVVELVSMMHDLPPEAFLVVVGEGEGRQRVLEATEKLAHRERVRVVGFARDTTPYYAACNLFANPISLDRPWITVLEAQSFGRPVVVMRSTSAEATVADGRTGLLANDVDEFRGHVASLVSDQTRCTEMGHASRNYVATSHSVQRQAEQIEHWFAARTTSERSSLSEAQSGQALRIAFHAPRSTYLTPGGSGDRVFVRGVLEGLRDRGHEVEIVSRQDVRDFWRKRVPARRLVAEALAVRRKVKSFAPDVWLVFGTSTKYPDLFGWWQRPRRYVLLKTDAGTEEGLPRPWRWLFSFAHRRSLARAEVVGVERPRSALHLQGRGVVDKPVIVVPLAAASWDLPSRSHARRRLALPAEARIVLCVSRLTGPRDDGKPWKTEGILAMLDAVSRANLPAEALVVLAGDGPGRRLVEDKVAEHGLDDRVRLFGSVSYDDVRWLFAACDLYAHYTLRDRMFTTILEAQACEKPVIASRNPSTEVIVDHGRTGLLASDSAEFTRSLEALVADSRRCAAMGTAAREYIERYHTMEVRVSQIEAVLAGTGVISHQPMMVEAGD